METLEEFWVHSSISTSDHDLKIKIERSNDFDKKNIFYFYWEDQKFPPHGVKSIYNAIIGLINKIAEILKIKLIFHEKINPDWEPVFIEKYEGIKTNKKGEVIRGTCNFFTRFHYHILCIWTCPLLIYNDKPILHFMAGCHSPVIIPHDNEWYKASSNYVPLKIEDYIRSNDEKKAFKIGKWNKYKLKLLEKFNEILIKLAPEPDTVTENDIFNDYENINCEIQTNAIFNVNNILEIFYIGYPPIDEELPSSIYELIHGIPKFPL